MTSPNWEIFTGDCREILPKISHADHLITDSPYSERVHSRLGKEGRSDGSKSRSPLAFAALDASLADAVCKEATRLRLRWCLFFGDEFSFLQWVKSGELSGLEYVRHGAWVKANAMPQMSGDRPSAGLENIAIMHGPRTRGRMHWNGGGNAAIWIHPVVTKDRLHVAQKPLALMTEIVSSFTRPGDTIIDPFCGSGMTGVACIQLGRKFIGIELDAETADLARSQLSKARLAQQEALFR